MTTARAGRPRGYEVNPDAIEDLLEKAGISKSQLCDQSEISPGHLSDMLHRQKGASITTVKRMARTLRCRPGTIAPSLTTRFVAVRRVAA